MRGDCNESEECRGIFLVSSVPEGQKHLKGTEGEDCGRNGVEEVYWAGGERVWAQEVVEGSKASEVQGNMAETL